MEVEPVLLTKPWDSAVGLATFYLKVPVYVWTELLTHKRLVRNASSSRAQSTSRHLLNGQYVPDVFYGDKAGMRVGDILPAEMQTRAKEIYKEAWEQASLYVEALSSIGVSREQANRLLPTTKYIEGLVTATESAWSNFLYLRNSHSSDVAMHLVAGKIQEDLVSGEWVSRDYHFPFAKYYGEDSNIMAGRIARISYSPSRSFSDQENFELGKRLRKDGHLSPFEHLAIYKINPLTSALCSMDGDREFQVEPNMGTERYFGWENLRVVIEENHG